MPISVEQVTLKELRECVEAMLGENQVFDNFFGNMIRDRMNYPGWLSNGLVQLIVNEAKENISLIEDVLNNVRESAGDALDQLRNEKQGSERNFDKAINDVWAEVYAVDWLINNGFSNIAKIKSSNATKSPDFKATKDGNVLVEVKNLRAPSELSSALMTAIGSQHLLYPKLYNRLLFTVKIQDQALKRNPTSALDDLGIEQFCNQLSNALLEELDSITFEYRTVSRGLSGKVSIECSWKTHDHFSIWCRSTSSTYCRKVGANRLPEILPLLGKTWNAVERSYGQLTAENHEASHQRIILLNWQKPSYVQTDDELQAHFRTFVAGLGSALQTVDKNVSVHVI